MAEGQAIPTLNDIVNKTLEVIWNITKYPVGLWNNAPIYLKLVVYSIIVLVAFIIIILVWKNRNAWRTRYY